MRWSDFFYLCGTILKQKKMKTIPASLLMALIALFGCSSSKDAGLLDVEKKAEKIRKEVLDSQNTVKYENYHGGRCWFVSTEGDDSCDGLSPETAIQSIDRVNSLPLEPGDAVLFRRGDTWRRTRCDGKRMIKTRPGVIYSSYGEGAKPVINGSPFNGADPDRWEKTEIPGVWHCKFSFGGDVGGIILDGKDSAFKVMISHLGEEGQHIDTSEPFSGWKDLRRDLDFYQDGDSLYLCSLSGNPSERFSEIEFNVHGHCFEAADDVTIDNFNIRHTGSHGIGSQTTHSLTVTNCEVAWIGGSIQPGQWRKETQSPIRYGNGVEIYGGCGRYTIRNCWVYQCYDAGITHQYSSRRNNSVIMENVRYEGNLIEDCVYSIEYFLHLSGDPAAERMMKHVIFKGNVCRRAGYGWGRQRPDKETPAHIKTWSAANPAQDFVISGNIFDRSTHAMLQIQAARPEWMPVMRKNTIIR